MTKFAKLDSEVLSAIGAQPASFSELFSPSVRQECLVIAEAEGKHPMDVFRILDRRLQSLRKLGVIQHVKGKGWIQP
ncbi:hypothetical protein ACIP3K_002928 [Enterobacter hormaechei]|uniref:hypothetical protein n=1 Tax=Enterobacter hormaechei TaxID=158836 RepID=UPI0018690B05|nr:hypothetical protein [Enterobacter hormaechei]ELD3412197.1 hypothetical protein [Enterobacter hormaechei]MCU3661202.1 hypothetical protein [Enterobacter hormaechei subsp. steigerwaltii]MCU3793584.1 hypothetical protein [Enterobacter hormaechei subsp. steigerwaltii]MDM9326384.1 hypothetical protein [Enterobacter hormaechei subsp. steigerwaltii]